eukprot:10201164-Ditylum_brightwellii.AAC.1
MSSKTSSTAKKANFKKSKSVKDEQDDDSDISSADSRVCNIAYNAMDGKVEDVISNFREKKGKMKPWYAACTLEYYPKASDGDEETREGCVLILNGHFIDVNDIHADMFDYTNSQLIVLKMQGYGNKAGKDG